MIEKIVSGGQTGVDRAALNIALTLGINCGGWCPRERRAEDGVIPSCYPLTECDERRYQFRTEKNVLDSDGTLILMLGALSGGTALTARLANRHERPLYLFDLNGPADIAPILSWIDNHAIHILDVAGPRESQRPGIGARACEVLGPLFERTSA